MPFATRWFLVALLLVAFALRLTLLDDNPPGLRYDEMLSHVMAKRVMNGERPIYFHESWGREPLYFYVQALSLHWFGESDWAMRLPSALFGLFEVVGVWLIGRHFFNKQVGLWATALTAVSFWAIFYARIGCRVGSTTAFACFMTYFLWRTLQEAERGRRLQAWLYASLTGLFLGLLIYVYVAGRMGFFLWGLFALYLLFVHREQFKKSWLYGSWAGLFGGLIAFPLLYYLYFLYPEQEQRLDLIAEPLNELRVGNFWPVLTLTVQAWGMYVYEGEKDWLFNVYGRPIFDPLLALFFGGGILYCVWQWRKPAPVYLLLWLLAGTVPAMLATPAASLTHTIFAQPAALLLTAVGLAQSSHWLNESKPKWGTALTAGVLLFFTFTSTQAYFFTWRYAPEVRELYQGGIKAVADAYINRTTSGPVVMGGPFINYWHPWNAVSFDLSVAQDSSTVRWFNPAGAWVYPAGTETISYYFPTAPLAPQTYNPLLQAQFLAAATPIPLDTDNYLAYTLPSTEVFHAHRQTLSTTLQWPPDLTHLPTPAAPLSFNNRLALTQVELLTPTAKPGEAVRFLTYWHILQPDPSPLVAFVHLTSDGFDIWGQQDWLDVRLAGLQTDDYFVQLHEVGVNPATPAGVYQLQLGLYRPDTSQRLPITFTTGQADRVWVGAVEIIQP